MDILHLLHMQNKLVPEMVKKFNDRYELLLTIKINQPVGRKTLLNFVTITERQLRTECEVLSKLGLIAKKTTGMSLTEKGEEFLVEIKSFITNDTFVKERGIIKKHFSIKDVYIVAGDFVNSEATRVEMTDLLLDKVNSKITKECVIGVSGGSTMYYVADRADKTFGYGKDVTITPIRGGLSEVNTEYQSNDIAAKMANNSGNNYQLLHAPDNIGEKALEELVKEPVVKNALDVIEKTSIIIHSIGNAFEMAYRRRTSSDILEVLKKKNAVCESFGSYFDEDGHEIFKTSTIGMNFKDVDSIGDVFTIVGGENKAQAVFSYLNTKPVNATLIIDEAICRKIITKINK
ncbi:sugar-binding domain protein [Gemella bergeri ATCC 700627]|uniref:Sugar-binding domain protein n=1 Tax=Gemella bergeri ATCC 700627 TaxID=1321820 RepID=U2QWJ3_9BACL|nr:sugar-binding domain-containing protein [Gemella bergeri]ERK60579.1 sugar-binding domain protein [Gemella bergeri ATCC 700627]